MIAEEDLKILERKTADLANTITHYAIDNCLSFSEVMKSVEIVKEAFLQAAAIKKGWNKSA